MSQNIKKITSYLFALKFLGLFVSLFVLSLSAKFFGISEERDIWILATSFLTAIAGALFGPLNETFRAKFSHLKETESNLEIERKLSSLIGFVIIIAIILSIILALFPNIVVKIVAPSLGNSTPFYEMFILLIPSLLLNQLIYLGIGILNIHNIFYIPEIVGFFSALINLTCIYILAPTIGIYSLIVSQYIYLVIYFLVVLYFLYKKGISVIPNFLFRWGEIKPFILYSLPFFLPYFFGQCSMILEKSLANLLGEGIVSILDYSRRFSTILQTVLTSVLASVMVTDLTRSYSQKKWEEYSVSKYKYLEITNIILCLSLPILIGSARIISILFFMKGDINLADSERIARLMEIYCFSFIGISLYLFYGLTLLSQMKGKIYALSGIATQICVIIINIFFYRNLKEYIFPISVGIGHFLSAFVMAHFVTNDNKKEEFRLIVKCLFFILLATAVIYGENIALEKINSIIVLCLNFLTLSIISFFILFPFIGINGFQILKTWKNKI